MAPSEFQDPTKHPKWKITKEELSNPIIKLSPKDSAVLLDDLRLAAVRNNVDNLQFFLKNDVDIESRMKSGWTVLMHAAYAASIDSVRFLLEQGASVHAQHDELTVLMVACGSSSRRHRDVLSCVNQLLDRGANVNAYNWSRMSPLMFAARCGHVEVVRRLVALQDNLDEQDAAGYTALMHAVQTGRTSVVRVLLRAQADLGKQTPDGLSAINLAYKGGHKELQRLLEDHQPTPGERVEIVWNEVESVEMDDDDDDVASMIKNPVEQCYTYTNLDLFLSGLDLGELIPLFQQRNISFARFLRLTDQDLIEMGIYQLGVRKRILDALKVTHKRNWETSSLCPMDYNRKIACVDSVAVIANVLQHAEYIASTIGYMSDQISADKEIIHKAPENKSKELCINTDEAIVNTKHLYEELYILKARLAKICRYHDFNPPDLIKVNPSHSVRLTRRSLLLATAAATVGCVSLMAVVWVKREEALVLFSHR